jgi:glycosyltransferase involved in cell wall biosynthesis
MNYILITPVKDEEKNLPNLSQCIIKQTYLPRAWIIVDDNCTDQTPEIIKNLKNSYNWIYSIKKKEINEYSHLSFARSVKIGYEYAKELCKQKNIHYDYVGKIDADIKLPENYFETIIKEFENDHSLAIISGSYYDMGDRLTKPLFILDDEMADERLYRKDFLDEINGFPITYSPDTVLLIYAKLRNWKFKELQSVQCFGIRKLDQSGNWKRMINKGYGRYFLNYHPVLVFMNALYMTTKKPYYNGIALFYGYLFGVIKKDKKINDLEVRNYFRYKRWGEVRDKIRLKIKNSLNI